MMVCHVVLWQDITLIFWIALTSTYEWIKRTKKKKKMKKKKMKKKKKKKKKKEEKERDGIK